MKSKRLTILCVAVVALAGTPRVWNEAGKLLAIVQHKAQVKFWSMVLGPGAQESSSVELVANNSSSKMRSTEASLNCDLEDGSRPANLAKAAKSGQRDSIRRDSRGKARQKTAGATVFSDALIAKALKTPREGNGSESFRHIRYISESEPSLLAERSLTPIVLDGLAALPQQSWNEGNSLRFVMAPATGRLASTLGEKDAFLLLKTIKKAVEDNKLARPKVRGRMRNSDPGVRI